MRVYQAAEHLGVSEDEIIRLLGSVVSEDEDGRVKSKARNRMSDVTDQELASLRRKIERSQKGARIVVASSHVEAERVPTLMNGITSEVMLVTPDMATSWLKNNHPKNRPIYQSRVSPMAKDMASGAWMVTHQGICFDGDGYLIDGQHRLSAIIQSGVSVSLLVCRNESGDITDPIDTHRLRTISFLTGKDNRTVAAMKVLYGYEQGYEFTGMVTPADVRDIFERYREDYDSVRCSGKSKLWGGILGALIYSIPIDRESVNEFAEKICTGEMIKRGDPAFAFRSWKEKTLRATPWQMGLATLSCLRYHLSGSAMTHVYTADAALRAFATRRRAMRIPHTASVDLIPSGNWSPQRES